jgi:hypothetical protein
MPDVQLDFSIPYEFHEGVSLVRPKRTFVIELLDAFGLIDLR